MSITEITSAKQYAEVCASGGTNIIIAYTPWCQNCKVLKDALSAYKRENTSYWQINAEAIEDFADADDVKKAPTVFVYKSGAAEAMHVGADIGPLMSYIS